MVAVSGICFAAGIKQRIVLLDHSVIIGEVTEMKDGVYTVRSEAVGEIKISAEKIVEITKLDSAQPAASTKSIGILDGTKKSARKTVAPAPALGGSDDLKLQQERANSQVQSMTMQEDFMEDMMSLSGSNDMVDVMSDPEIMEAISRNDYEFLMNNEKMKSLMESSEIKDLLGE